MIEFVKINTLPGRTFPQHFPMIVPFDTTFPKGKLFALCTSFIIQSRVKVEPTVSLFGQKKKRQQLNIFI